MNRPPLAVFSGMNFRLFSFANFGIRKKIRHFCSGPEAEAEASSSKWKENCFPDSESNWESKLNEAQRKELEKIRREYEIYRSVDFRMPNEISPKNWIRLLKESKARERLIFFWKLGSDERRIFNKKFQQPIKQKERLELLSKFLN